MVDFPSSGDTPISSNCKFSIGSELVRWFSNPNRNIENTSTVTPYSPLTMVDVPLTASNYPVAEAPSPLTMVDLPLAGDTVIPSNSENGEEVLGDTTHSAEEEYASSMTDEVVNDDNSSEDVHQDLTDALSPGQILTNFNIFIT